MNTLKTERRCSYKQCGGVIAATKRSHARFCSKTCYSRDYDIRHRKERRARSDRYNAARLRCQRDYLAKLKAKGCVDCGRRYPKRLQHLLHFDHLPGYEKLCNVSRALRCRSRAALEAEIAKCEIRCVSCHEAVTKARGQSVTSGRIGGYASGRIRRAKAGIKEPHHTTLMSTQA